MREIELLAPAKSYDSVCAAIDHGADAVYIGGSKFGARAAACNSVEDIARAVEYAHQYGARLYATLNTLIFEEELKEAEKVARELVATGLDALIVQDMAYARMGLDVELHCSTQMTNIIPERVQFLSKCGFSRVVLERNLTLSEIEAIAQQGDTELEAFIHGAICVGQSGRCLLSKTMSSRSGNRGECSQPCRMSYDLVDAAGRKIMEAKHLLSVKDLNLTTHIGALLDAGVSSFKIEGRLKELSYTKNIVAHYRNILDREIAQRADVVRASSGYTSTEFVPNPAKSFSRGSTIYMIDGKRVGVASFDTPKATGEAVGTVVEQRRDKTLLVMERGKKLITGDGICYMTREGLKGGNVVGVTKDGDRVWVTLSNTNPIAKGCMIYRNFDREFEAQLSGSRTERKIEITARVESLESGVVVTLCDRDGYSVSGDISAPLEMSNNPERIEAAIRETLCKCGGTIFECTEVDLSQYKGEFIPKSQLTALRRELLNELRERRLEGAKNRDRKIFSENMEAQYPSKKVTAEEGVTNSLARRFYEDHGAEEVEESYERAASLKGVEVLRSAYCIRREIGECKREGSTLRGELFLERGNYRYRLDFDCVKCEMRLINI